jgi:hypothetical protein
MTEDHNKLKFTTEPVPKGFTVLKAADLAVTETTTFTLEDKRQYRCPVHGITTTDRGSLSYGGMFSGNAINRTPHLAITVGPKEKQGYYCFLCYVDWVHATFPKLEEVEGK